MNKDLFIALAAVAVVSLALGAIAYAAILAFRRYKSWANAKFEALAQRIQLISRGSDRNHIVIYGIYGFLNASVEWQVPAHYSRENVDELLSLSAQFQALSIKLCCMALHPVGVFLALLNGIKTRRTLRDFKANM